MTKKDKNVTQLTVYNYFKKGKGFVLEMTEKYLLFCFYRQTFTNVCWDIIQKILSQ